MNQKFSIKIIAAAFGLLVAGSSFAASPAAGDGITPYAQVRLWAGYVNQSKEVIGPTATDADTDWSSRLTTSRLGVKAKYGDLDGVVEMGLSGFSTSASSITVTTRKIYGVYNYTPDISFLFGQDEAPFTYYSNALANDDLNCGFGNTFADRDLQLKITAYNLYIDVMNPTTPAFAGYTAGNFDILIPRLAAGYEYKNSDKTIQIGAGGAGQTSRIDVTGDPLKGEMLISYLAYAHGKLVMGDLSVLLNFGFGQNTANMGLNYKNAFMAAATSTKAAPASAMMSTSAEVNGAGDGISDTRSMEGFVEATYRIAAVDLTGGAGYVQAKNPNWTKTDAQIMYYAQLSIPFIEKRLYIVPTLQYRDFMKGQSGEKQGNEALAGLFVQAVY